MRFSLALAAVVVMVMAGVKTTEGEMVEVDDSNWWETCKRPVCTVADKQAEGLARLKVLSDYIRETMVLMESVVASLNSEIASVGEELSGVVGRRCHSRAAASLTSLVDNLNHADTQGSKRNDNILEVLTDDADAHTQENQRASSWSSGVESLSGQASTTSFTHSPPSTSRSSSQSGSSTSHSTSSTSYSTSHSVSQHPSGSSQSGSWRPLLGPNSSSQDLQTSGSSIHTSSLLPVRGSHTSSDSSAPLNSNSFSTKAGQHHRTGSSLKRYEGELQTSESQHVAPAIPEAVSGGGTSNQGGGGGYTGGKGRGANRGVGVGRGKSQIQSSSEGGRYEQTYGGPPASNSRTYCRGVPIGSPHYVPGLDSWCANNCPRNCPSTHCIC